MTLDKTDDAFQVRLDEIDNGDRWWSLPHQTEHLACNSLINAEKQSH